MDTYKDFLRELINTAIEDGDVMFASSAWCQTYCRIVKMDYTKVIRNTIEKWRTE